MTTQQNSKKLHIALWIVQVLLAFAFGMAGFMKITKSVEQLAQMGLSFVTSYEPQTILLIGTTEVLAAIGLILPAALRILPFLTPLAATGLSIVMILATQYHVAQGEPFVATVLLLALAVFVAWGRFMKAPIHPKS